MSEFADLKQARDELARLIQAPHPPECFDLANCIARIQWMLNCNNEITDGFSFKINDDNWFVVKITLCVSLFKPKLFYARSPNYPEALLQAVDKFIEAVEDQYETSVGCLAIRLGMRKEE